MRTFFVALLLLPAVAHAKKAPPPPPPEWRCGEAVATDYAAANTALLKGQAADANTGFTTVLAAEPQCGLALLGQGRALLDLGRPADAMTPLASAATLFSDKVEAQVWLSKARLATGDADGAIAAAKAAIALKPGSVDAQRAAQDALRAKKDYAAAHQLLTEARAVANVVAWNCLDGLVFADEGDAAKAAEMLVTCDGVPDRSLYDALAARVTPAP